MPRNHFGSTSVGQLAGVIATLIERFNPDGSVDPTLSESGFTFQFCRVGVLAHPACHSANWWASTPTLHLQISDKCSSMGYQLRALNPRKHGLVVHATCRHHPPFARHPILVRAWTGPFHARLQIPWGMARSDALHARGCD